MIFKNIYQLLLIEHYYQSITNSKISLYRIHSNNHNASFLSKLCFRIVPFQDILPTHILCNAYSVNTDNKRTHILQFQILASLQLFPRTDFESKFQRCRELRFMNCFFVFRAETCHIIFGVILYLQCIAHRDESNLSV